MTGPTPTATTSSRASPPATHVVSFNDPIGEYAGEYYNNVPLTDRPPPPASPWPPARPSSTSTPPSPLLPSSPPSASTSSGTVRDEPRRHRRRATGRRVRHPGRRATREVVARTYSNRAGAYHFTELDRLAGKTQFKVSSTVADGPREEGDFARRDTWSGDKVGYETAVRRSRPRRRSSTSPCRSPVASPAPSPPRPAARRRAATPPSPTPTSNLVGSEATEADGTTTTARCGRATTPSMFGAYLPRPRVVEGRPARGRHHGHRQARPGRHRHLRRPDQGGQGDRAPEIVGQRVGRQDPRLDAGRWNTQARSKYHATSGSSATRSSRPARR